MIQFCLLRGNADIKQESFHYTRSRYLKVNASVYNAFLKHTRLRMSPLNQHCGLIVQKEKCKCWKVYTYVLYIIQKCLYNAKTFKTVIWTIWKTIRVIETIYWEIAPTYREEMTSVNKQIRKVCIFSPGLFKLYSEGILTRIHY